MSGIYSVPSPPAHDNGDGLFSLGDEPELVSEPFGDGTYWAVGTVVESADDEFSVPSPPAVDNSDGSFTIGEG